MEKLIILSIPMGISIGSSARSGLLFMPDDPCGEGELTLITVPWG